MHTFASTSTVKHGDINRNISRTLREVAGGHPHCCKMWAGKKDSGPQEGAEPKLESMSQIRGLWAAADSTLRNTYCTWS